MLYAIAEIMAFLIIAVSLGLILGWFLRGLFLRRRLEASWRTECDKHKKQAALVQTQLDDCLRLNDKPRPVPGNDVQAKLPESQHPESQRDEPAPDKASAQKQVRTIAQRTAGAQPINDDDLKKVRGIGPVLEKSLKSMDILSYRQIANFTRDDIRYVAAALGSFPGRIERDNWVNSAREEHKKKYGTSDESVEQA